MTARRVLLIESQTGLCIRDSRLCLQREAMEDVFVSPEDIAVLILHHHAIHLNVHVVRAIAKTGGMIMVTDENHFPTGILWPWTGSSMLVRRLRQQILMDGHERKGDLWKQLVQGRIATQALNLRHFRYNGALRLERLYGKVEPNDPNNIEAQATRHYWRHFLPSGIRREKQGSLEPFNIRLNFGYAVLRSLVAREIAAAGLNPALGLGHRNLENQFNLADDFMEPYRYTVERQVLEGNITIPFDGAARVALLKFISAEVELGERTFRLQPAIAETIASYTRVLNRRKNTLNIPRLSC